MTYPKPTGGILPVKLEAVLARLQSHRPLTLAQAATLPYLVDVIAVRVLGHPITEAHYITLPDPPPSPST